jgi:hypothetical protein
MNLQELSERYMYLGREAEKVGLTQKAQECKAVADALVETDLNERYGTTHVPVDVLMKWHTHFEDIAWAVPRFYREDGQTWLGAVRDWLFSESNWSPNVIPGFVSAGRRLLNNVKIVLFWYLSPWFRITYWFTEAFTNFNDCKLLADGVYWVCVRSRELDPVYFGLTFHGFRYTLRRWEWVVEDKDGKGRSANQFVNSLGADESSRLKRVEGPSHSGWVFGWKSFVREFKKVVDLTPELHWNKSL